MRIGIVTQWYPPERGAAIPSNIARALHDAGNDISVLTGVPNYPTGDVYPGYSLHRYQRESIDEIAVHRVGLYPSHDSRPVPRAMNYLSFAAMSALYIERAFDDVEVCLVYSSPMTAALAARALKFRRGVPYVLLVQDMWPQSVMASEMLASDHGRRIERMLHRLCDSIYRHSAEIAVTSPGMTRLIAQRGVQESKLHFAPNWVDERWYYPAERDEILRRELGIVRRFTVMYAGNLGIVQGLETVIDAAEKLRDRVDIGFVFVGSGAQEAILRARVAAHHLENVTFVGPQPPERMSRVLAAADVQLVSLKDDMLFRSTLPSKLQSLLAAGRPILGAVSGDAAQIIERSGAGMIAAPGSTADLVSSIEHFARLSPTELTEMGQAGRKYYLAEFSSGAGVRRLELILKDAVSHSRLG